MTQNGDSNTLYSHPKCQEFVFSTPSFFSGKPAAGCQRALGCGAPASGRDTERVGASKQASAVEASASVETMTCITGRSCHHASTQTYETFIVCMTQHLVLNCKICLFRRHENTHYNILVLQIVPKRSRKCGSGVDLGKPNKVLS